MKVLLSAPDWDEQVDLPALPPVGTEIIRRCQSWTVTGYQVDVDGLPPYAYSVEIDPTYPDQEPPDVAWPFCGGCERQVPAYDMGFERPGSSEWVCRDCAAKAAEEPV